MDIYWAKVERGRPPEKGFSLTVIIENILWKNVHIFYFFLELKKLDHVKDVNYDLQMEKGDGECCTVSHIDDSAGLGSAHLSLSLLSTGS